MILFSFNILHPSSYNSDRHIYSINTTHCGRIQYTWLYIYNFEKQCEINYKKKNEKLIQVFSI